MVRTGVEHGPGAPLETLALVRFESAGRCLALEASKIGAMRNPTETAAPSLDELLEWPQSTASEPSRQRLLEIVHPDWRRLIRVGEPVVHFELPVRAIQPLPPLLAARLRHNGVRALALLGEPPAERLLILLDAWRLAH